MGKVVNGLQSVAGGYYWKRVVVGYPKTPIKIEQNKVKGMNISKPVVQTNDNGDIIMIFKSIKEASKAVGVGEKVLDLRHLVNKSTLEVIVGNLLIVKVIK